MPEIVEGVTCGYSEINNFEDMVGRCVGSKTAVTPTSLASPVCYYHNISIGQGRGRLEIHIYRRTGVCLGANYW